MLRHLDWPGCRNVRDLGGLATADGGQITTGALIRADGLHNLTPEGIETVRRSGVGRILDLRTYGELELLPSPFAGDPLCAHMPVEDPADPPHTMTTIVDVCISILDRHPELLVAALVAIAEAPEGAVVVHCHGGKDRTGMVVALALAVAGVPEDEIVADYALTKERMADALAEQLAAEPDESLHPEMIEFRDTRAESMTAILEHVDSAYGGASAYLRRGGMTTAQLDALRHRMRA